MSACVNRSSMPIAAGEPRLEERTGGQAAPVSGS